MEAKNQMRITFKSFSENVGIARMTAAAFASQVDFSINDIEEIKVAVSEAISNCIIHAYSNENGLIEFIMNLYVDRVEYIITDYGKGIADVNKVREPSYSTAPERMGLGFVFMESFMDDFQIESALGKGTTVRLSKKVTKNKAH